MTARSASNRATPPRWANLAPFELEWLNPGKTPAELRPSAPSGSLEDQRRSSLLRSDVGMLLRSCEVRRSRDRGVGQGHLRRANQARETIGRLSLCAPETFQNRHAPWTSKILGKILGGTGIRQRVSRRSRAAKPATTPYSSGSTKAGSDFTILMVSKLTVTTRSSSSSG